MLTMGAALRRAVEPGVELVLGDDPPPPELPGRDGDIPQQLVADVGSVSRIEAVLAGCDAGRVAARQSITRQPWYLAAWILVAAALPVVLFGPFVLGLVLFLGSLVAYVIAIRTDRAGRGHRRAPEPPPQ